MFKFPAENSCPSQSCRLLLLLHPHPKRGLPWNNFPSVILANTHTHLHTLQHSPLNIKDFPPPRCLSYTMAHRTDANIDKACQARQLSLTSNPGFSMLAPRGLHGSICWHVCNSFQAHRSIIHLQHTVETSSKLFTLLSAPPISSPPLQNVSSSIL